MDAAPLLAGRSDQLAPLAVLAAIPEEEVWLASQKSARTRRASHTELMRFIASREEVEQAKYAGLTLSSRRRQTA